MEKYKERCSQLGKIMTNARSIKKDAVLAGDKLGETAKQRVEEAYLFNEFGIRNEINNKYLEKGTDCEDDSIDLFKKVTGMFAVKNKINFENDFVKGTPDIIKDNVVVDIKTSWSGATYPWFDTELSNKAYMYQLQGYMWLTGVKKAILAYCLTDANESLIQDEVRRTVWQKKMIDPTEEQLNKIEDDVRAQMTFGHVPSKLRVKMFEVNYEEKIIEEMKARIALCGEYYDEISLIINNLKK